MQCKKKKNMLRYQIVALLCVRLGYSALFIDLTHLLFTHKQKKKLSGTWWDMGFNDAAGVSEI